MFTFSQILIGLRETPVFIIVKEKKKIKEYVQKSENILSNVFLKATFYNIVPTIWERKPLYNI